MSVATGQLRILVEKGKVFMGDEIELKAFATIVPSNGRMFVGSAKGTVTKVSPWNTSYELATINIPK